MNDNELKRLTELLADRATQNLSAEEQRELSGLLAHYTDVDATAFERAAAAIQLTEAMPETPLPKHLQNKIVADAQEFFGAIETEKTVAVAERKPVVERQKSFSNFWQWAGWYAAAAIFAVALLVSWPQIKNMFFAGNVSDPGLIAMREQRLLETRRNDLLGAAKALKQNWSVTKFPGVEKVEGDVVWSSEKQQGYMRFKNLTANDPNQNVYQLWIFDANQDEKFPVDGGVFNVTKSGEIIVPINAKLNIKQPTLFAVTIEKPGGVVVSKRDKLILTAKVG